MRASSACVWQQCGALELQPHSEASGLRNEPARWESSNLLADSTYNNKRKCGAYRVTVRVRVIRRQIIKSPLHLHYY